MTEAQIPPAIDPDRRRAVSEYERTISILASAASTRTYICDSPPHGVSGCYDWHQNRIILYPTIEGIDPVVVALEEAGHSQARAAYVRYEDSTKAFVTRASVIHPGARMFLDWLEDWRVFNLLEKKFPGAAPRFRRHFDLRRRFFQQVLERGPDPTDLRPDMSRRVSRIMLRIAEEYCSSPEKAPRTYLAVIRRANDLLHELEQPEQEEQQTSAQSAPPQFATSQSAGDDNGDDSENDSGDSDDSASSGDKDEGEQKKGSSLVGEDGDEGEGVGQGEDGQGQGEDQDSQEPSQHPSGDADASGEKGGTGGTKSAPISEDLRPYIIGIVLVAREESRERLHRSADWRMKYQRPLFRPAEDCRRGWKQIDGALLAPAEESE